jgi:hypothetical protein
MEILEGKRERKGIRFSVNLGSGCSLEHRKRHGLWHTLVKVDLQSPDIFDEDRYLSWMEPVSLKIIRLEIHSGV